MTWPTSLALHRQSDGSLGQSNPQSVCNVWVQPLAPVSL